MSRTEKECCDDEKLLEQITGGTREQVQEIYDYVRIDDLEGYAAIIASPYPSDWMMLRYLNDHGFPWSAFPSGEIRTISMSSATAINRITSPAYGSAMRKSCGRSG